MKNTARRAGRNYLVAFTLIILLAFTSGSAIAREESHLLGSAEGNESTTQGLTVEANRVERNEKGNLISVDWSIANHTDSDVVLTWLHEQETYTYNGDYYSGVSISDPETETRYHPLMDKYGECICAGNTSGRFFNQVVADGYSPYWSLFSTPSDVDTINLEVPGFEPIEDIPID